MDLRHLEGETVTEHGIVAVVGSGDGTRGSPGSF